MGSGSTGVACRHTNRNFIGMEIDEEYYKVAKEKTKMSNEYKDWLRDKLEEEKLTKYKIEAYVRLTNELINDWKEQDFYCEDIDVPEWITNISKEMIKELEGE